MKKYEIMTLTKGSLGEENAQKFSKQITQVITDLGGKIETNDFWGKRKLSYQIGQEKEGFYEVILFELDPEKINNLKSKLNTNDNLVRYLVTAKS
ncbi:30S ribosomal protein S6 [candidate division WWE3 bacterium RBG_19FT_COMBO_34_6]|uniref:Small ribosomal subunit protein bS6 n=1 Tax=candidate division WWE3 bacterium RBG_19FT_COMBO_34_6 TaxID=1802612 RepID=A0A1F4UND1_UNCKA|nr:MAG: 30S ribosomal protein S6 [candidate division WWE3 bacterium RBG_19FT_COMBO_34_6]